MQGKIDQDLSGNAAVRTDAAAEQVIWIPEFPGDEPEMEYTDWRDLVFVYSGVQAGE